MSTNYTQYKKKLCPRCRKKYAYYYYPRHSCKPFEEAAERVSRKYRKTMDMLAKR